VEGIEYPILFKMTSAWLLHAASQGFPLSLPFRWVQIFDRSHRLGIIWDET
jgi:hypothetical protein